MLIIGGIAGHNAMLKGMIYKQREKTLATIDKMNFEEKTIKELIRFTPDISVRTEKEGKDIRFTAASLVGNRLYVGSPTQVYVYSFPDMKLEFKIDSPYFNDVHHVNEIDGFIYVVSTGLDAVLKFTLDGDFLEITSVIRENIWEKFDESIDYRMIASTKPHESHPNYIFKFDGVIYVTRFKQRDAIGLYQRDRKLDIAVGTPHDGVVIDDKVYFTNVDGKIVCFEKGNREPTVYDLNSCDDRGVPLGWCRGLLIQGNIVYVGFSAIRPTKLEENLLWMRSKFRGTDYTKRLPSRIAKYDLQRMELLGEFVLPEGSTDIIFSILPVES